MQCLDLPDYMGIDKGPNVWDPSPEYYAYLEKECGKIPENYSFYYYHDKFNKYMNDYDNAWEAVIY